MKGGLELLPDLSASQVLGFQACTTTPSLKHKHFCLGVGVFVCIHVSPVAPGFEVIGSVLGTRLWLSAKAIHVHVTIELSSSPARNYLNCFSWASMVARSVAPGGCLQA